MVVFIFFIQILIEHFFLKKKRGEPDQMPKKKFKRANE